MEGRRRVDSFLVTPARSQEPLARPAGAMIERRASIAPDVPTVFEESIEDHGRTIDARPSTEQQNGSSVPTTPKTPYRNRTLSRRISQQISQDRNKREEEENENAIDRYYENNQYSVTGIFQKNNQDTMTRIPANYQKFLRESREGADLKSTKSTRSKPALPIPGANENRFTSSFYWLAAQHRVIGLRHLLMFGLVVTYSLLGGWMFSMTESSAERRNVADAVVALESALEAMAVEMANGASTNDSTFTEVGGARQFLKDAYQHLLKAEGRWDQSAFQKSQSDDGMLWNFWSAVFYSTNLFMTVGYGTIAPVTDLGRVLTVVYSIIFIPLSNVVIRDLGQWFLVGLTRVYARFLIRWKRARGEELDDDEDIVLPISITALIVLLYWLLCSFLTWVYDAMAGSSGSGMTFWGSVYFSFITLTAIGLGDYMPNNVPRSPLMKIWYFLGLPVFKVVNRVSYVALENGIFGTFTVLENRLEETYLNRKAAEQVHRQDTEVPAQPIGGQDGLRRRRMSMASCKTMNPEEQEQINEALNNFTVRSIATFMKARSDVYAGDFGRVRMTKSQMNEQGL